MGAVHKLKNIWSKVDEWVNLPYVESSVRLLAWVLITIFVATKLPIGATIFVSLMISPMITVMFATKSIWTLAIFYLITQPAAVGMCFMVFLSIIHQAVSFPNWLLPILLFGSVISMTLFKVFIHYKDEVMLKKLYRALVLNNEFLLILGGILALYAFSARDVNFLEPVVNVQSMGQLGYSASDLIQYLAQYILFPFLTAHAISRVVISHILAAKEEKKLSSVS